MKRFLPEVFVACAILMVVSYGFAQSWTPAGSPAMVSFSLAVSADGRKIIGVGSATTVISTNSGSSWQTNGPQPYATAVAASADGMKVIGAYSVLGGTSYLYLSTNSGSLWNQVNLPLTNWQCCASSASGTTLAAAVRNGTIYTSTNSGSSWLTNAMVPQSWKALVASADGTRMAAAISSGGIYRSTNSGVTWTITLAPSSVWRAMASSVDGTYLVATGDSGTWLSTNRGDSWRSVAGAGFSAGISADGSKIIVGDPNDQIITSTNFGNNWSTTNISGKQWYSVAASADGSELVAGENQGIWLYRTMPSPQLTLTVTGNQAVVCWLVPSTNFGLLQATNLTTSLWSTVTNQPVLNLTNLQNQVNLSPGVGSVFYRLTTP